MNAFPVENLIRLDFTNNSMISGVGDINGDGINDFAIRCKDPIQTIVIFGGDKESL
jgi:hypothetical protein